MLSQSDGTLMQKSLRCRRLAPLGSSHLRTSEDYQRSRKIQKYKKEGQENSINTRKKTKKIPEIQDRRPRKFQKYKIEDQENSRNTRKKTKKFPEIQERRSRKTQKYKKEEQKKKSSEPQDTVFFLRETGSSP